MSTDPQHGSEWAHTYDMGKRHGYDEAINDLTSIALGRTDPVERTMLIHAATRLRDIAKIGRDD